MKGLVEIARSLVIMGKKEFLSNVRSLRLIAVASTMVLATTAALLGISGIGGPPPVLSNLLWAHPAQDAAANYEIVAWVSDSFGAPQPGIMVHIAPFSEQDGTTPTDSVATNQTGFVRFFNVSGNTTYSLWTDRGGSSLVRPDLLLTLANGFTFSIHQLDVSRDGTLSHVTLHAMDARGDPAVGAEVFADSTRLGATNGFGFFWAKLSPGDYGIVIRYQGQDQGPTPIRINTPRPSLYSGDPDAVLFFLAVSLMMFLGPIMAVALSYDAIARERVRGSMELLLSRPAARTGLALGKFIGTLGAASLAIVGPVVAGVLVLGAQQGKAPSLPFVVGFVFASFLLLALYILIAQVLSTVVRSPGTAVLSASVIWLFFTVLYSAVTSLALYALGVDLATPEGLLAASLPLLANPTGLYQLIVIGSAPAILQTQAPLGAAYLPPWSIPLAALLWIVALTILAVETFRHRGF